MTRRCAWVSALGAPYVEVEAEFDEPARTVTVDADTLTRMAQGVIDAGTLSEEDARHLAYAINMAPRVGQGRYDVTEFGPGFSGWQDMVLDTSTQLP